MADDAFKQRSWYVEYDGAGITADSWIKAFKRLSFVQNVRNMPSHATHVLSCKFDNNNKDVEEQLIKEVENLSYAMPISFRLASLGPQSVKGTRHYHVVVDWAFKTSPYGVLLVVKTMDRTALATLESKTRAHNGNSIDEIIVDILGEYQISDIVTEPCRKITHFSTLLQRNLTDMQFIMNELLPRSVSPQVNGGYSLFTSDGRKYYFESLGNTSNVYVAKANSLLSVKELDTNYSAARLGGFNYTVHGFDPFKKVAYVEKIGPDVTPSFGSTGPRIPQASRYDYVPLQTRDAVQAWVAERQYTNRYEAYPMIAQFRGSVDLDLPMQIDFSETKFRSTSTQIAPVVQIRHLLTVGRLTQTVTFLRDKTVL